MPTSSSSITMRVGSVLGLTLRESTTLNPPGALKSTFTTVCVAALTT